MVGSVADYSVMTVTIAAVFNPKGVRNCEITALVLASGFGDTRCSEHGSCRGHSCHGDQRQQKPGEVGLGNVLKHIFCWSV